MIRLQDGWRRAGEFVYLKEVYPPVPDADKIQFVERDDLREKADAKKSKNTKNCSYARGQLAFHFRQDLPQEKKINSVPLLHVFADRLFYQVELIFDGGFFS